MAKVHPLRGLRYNIGRVSDLAAVVAPPYDVISVSEQERLYQRSPYNAVRLEFGVQSAGDTASSNRYTRARSSLQDWLREGIVIRDPAPALYVHRQRFELRGKTLERTGIIAGLRLQEWSSGTVLPHEDTLPKPKQDRLQLLRTCQCNFSAIMVLFEDSHAWGWLRRYSESRPPQVEFAADDGQKHSLWIITDEHLINKVTQRLQHRPAFVADGHHRYETALEYRRELEGREGPLPEDHPANYVLAELFDFSDPGLAILPTHRVVRWVDPGRLANLMDGLARVFEVRPLPPLTGDSCSQLDSVLQTMLNLKPTAHAFGLYGPDRGRLSLISMPRGKAASYLPAVGSRAYRQLDVTVLHRLVLEDLLGIDANKVEDESHLTYTRDEAEALDLVDQGRAQLAILLNPTLPSEVRDVALAGDRMPQKSTYFYPKLPTGLVMNPLWTDSG